jgi:hypothetical protein
MNPNYPQSGAIPVPNPSYPMARLNGSAYAAPLNYNQPSEVVGGYDARINPMTGEEIPDTNFAKGGEVGLASLLASRGRGGDSMLVHMNPEEVKGLQALALAHGGSLTVNPDTGLVEALSLKSILPQIAGAVLSRFAPNLGKAVGTTLGFSEATAGNVGTGLIVGGISGLVEGDLKKGLMAGLGAYSGATLASGLAAADASRVTTAAPPTAGTFKDIPTTIEPTLSGYMKSSESSLTGKPTIASIGGGMGAAIDRTPPAPPPVSIKPSLTGGIRGLFTQEGREAFGKALGGGFESPFAQNLSRYATFAGATMPFAERPKAFPTGGAGEDIVYIPGGRNPQYGTGRDQPYYLPGQYYKRTDKGLVPANPFAKGFADGGAVQGPINVSPYAAPTNDPNVLATRSYIEELNRRVRSPYAAPSAGDQSGRALGGFGGMGAPIDTGGAAGGGDAGGGAGGVGGILGGIAANYLVNKGIESGLGYLQDKFFPSVDQLKEVEVTGKRQPEPTDQSQPTDQTQPVEPQTTGPATSPISYVSPALGAISPYAGSAPLPAGKVSIEPVSYEGDTQVVQDGTKIDRDLQDKTRVPDTSAPLSSYLSGASALGSGLAGLAGAGKAASIAIEMPIYDALGNLVGFSAAPGAAGAASAASGAAGAGAGASGAAGAGGAGAAGEAGLGSLQSKIIPGLQTALGAYEAYKGIESGKEGQAAMGAYGASAGLGQLLGFAGAGPIGLAAAAIAAIGASMVNTKEMGDVALRNYWNAVDQGRGFGSAPPQELAEGFINFYRTNKNEFPGQAKYGRTGNEDFVYDMTQVINDAVKSGKVGKDVDPATMYKEVVQPWLNTMGEGPKDADARRIQDFMMTDLIYNFMQGRPISLAQVKDDKKFKIVSEKPVYAGIAPELNRTIGGQEIPEDIARKMYLENNVRQEDLNSWAMSNPVGRMQVLGQMPAPQNPYAETQEPASIMPTGETVPITPYGPLEALPGPGLAGDDGRVVRQPYGETVPITPEAPVQEFVGTPYMPQPEIVPVSPYEAPSTNRPSLSDYLRSQGIDVPPPPPPAPVVGGPVELPGPKRELTPEEKAKYVDIFNVSGPPTDVTNQLVAPYEAPSYVPREEAVPVDTYAAYNPFQDFSYNPFEGFSMTQFAGGGAVGQDYNFGFAQGGRPMEYRAGGKFLQGPGDGMSDDIHANIDGKQEARLADGEFVIPADVVSHLGNGSSNAGAKKLHQMMARVRQARTGKKKQAPAVKMNRYLPA